jgi:hypothetical protein
LLLDSRDVEGVVALFGKVDGRWRGAARLITTDLFGNAPIP